MKAVDVSELKARLGEYLRAVRRGETITVVEKGRPIAEVVPAQAQGLRSRKPVGNFIKDVPLPPPLELKVDVVELLMEER